MIEQLFSAPKAMGRIRSGPLRPYVDSFAENLSRQGYSRWVLREKLRLVGVLSRWLRTDRSGIGDLDEALIERFLAHLRRTKRVPDSASATLRQLLEHLRGLGVIPPPASSDNDDEEVHPIEREFAQYLDQERGLSGATIRQQVSLARRFLSESFGSDPIELRDLGPDHVRQFSLRHAQRLKRRTTQTVLSMLKGFLRFLYQRGQTRMALT